jgi:class 3 adenylate cyclase
MQKKEGDMPICKACDAVNPERARFCIECGTKLTLLPESPDELKFVTVLFADLKGFTNLSSVLSPDRVKYILDDCFPELKSAVENENGWVLKSEGDSIMAAFGLKREGDLAPSQACYAAIKMQKSFQGFIKRNPCFGKDLGLRIGIHTGQVMVTRVDGRLDIIGDTVNLAKRMEQNAPVNQTLLSRDVASRVRERFCLAHKGFVGVKGKSAPVRTFVLSGKTGIHRRRVLSRFTNTVGRNSELDEIFASFDNVQEQSKPGLIYLESLPGLGKSRLLQDFEISIRDRGHFCYLFPCFVNSTVTSDFRLLKVLFYQLQATNQKRIIEQFEVDQTGLDNEYAKKYSATICRLLDFEHESSEWIDELEKEPEVLLKTALSGLNIWIETVSKKVPVVFCVDDVHNLDEGSLNAIEFLLTHSRGKLFFLTAGRPVTRIRERFQSMRSSTLYKLSRLDERSMKDLVSQMLDDVSDVPEGLIDSVLTFSDGNPFFAEEFVMFLNASGVIVNEDGFWSFSNKNWDKEILPASIEMLIQHRVDVLSKEHRRLLKVASVFGSQFVAESVGDICAVDGYFEMMEECMQRGLVIKDRQNKMGVYGQLKFSHQLIRDCIYRRLTSRQKKSYHKLVADWLNQHLGDNDCYALHIAHHYKMSGESKLEFKFGLISANNWFKNGQYENALQEYVQLKHLVEIGCVKPECDELILIQQNFDECLKQSV